MYISDTRSSTYPSRLIDVVPFTGSFLSLYIPAAISATRDFRACKKVNKYRGEESEDVFLPKKRVCGGSKGLGDYVF